MDMDFEKKWFPEMEGLKEFWDSVEPEIRWAVKDIFPEEGIGFIAGPPGLGKSWMLLDLAVEMARGGTWLGQFETSKGGVLIIDEESSRSLLRSRIGKLLNAKGLTPDELDIRLLIQRGAKLTDKDWIDRLNNYVYLTEPKLLIFDSLIRVLGCDENSSTEVAAVLNELKDLARRKLLLVLIADHHRKPRQFEGPMSYRIRGSSDKAAAADTVLSLKVKGGSTFVEHAKSRFAPPVESFAVDIVDTSDTATVILASPTTGPGRPESRKSREACIVLENLLTCDWSTRQQLIKTAAEQKIPQKRVVAALHELLECGYAESKKDEIVGRGRPHTLYRLKKTAE